MNRWMDVLLELYECLDGAVVECGPFPCAEGGFNRGTKNDSISEFRYLSTVPPNRPE